MTESAPEPQIILLGAPPMPGELIASYLRHRLPHLDVRLCASYADLKGGAARGFVLVETSVRSCLRIGERVARVRSDHPQAPILIASASPSLGSAVAARRCGAQGFLPRLTPLSALADALRTLLAGRTCFPHLVAVGRCADMSEALAAREEEEPPGEPAPASVELAILQGAFEEADPNHHDPHPRQARSAEASSGPERRRAEAQ